MASPQAVRCSQIGCSGFIEDGYCNQCGIAAKAAEANGTAAGSVSGAGSARAPGSAITTGTGSSPVSRGARGTRRTASHSTSRSSRRFLGAGLVMVPELPSIEPEKALMAEMKVPENKRFCSNCNNPLSREKGFCGKCGQKYSFVATLQRGDVVAGQYEVRGAIAFGGLGWIYLAFDKILSRYTVLKGLLNTEDEASAAAAVAERQFLAAVKHPNIVGIYNFVRQGNEGFIAMEYVGGKSLRQIRKERGPLPVSEAIAYIHRALGAFGYLHQLGLVYCDFKPDNLMLENNDVKLIDMGGVRRIDDPHGDIYGTIGYSAPEASDGPTVASDLYTIGRSLAVLVCDIKGFSRDHRYSLPSPAEEKVFAGQESFYRLLLKATAEHQDDRFQSADEMSEQLLGVLREVVADETGAARPSTSTVFSGDVLALSQEEGTKHVRASHRYLPMPLLDQTDPGFQLVVAASAIPDPAVRVRVLREWETRTPKSREAPLRLANTLVDLVQYDEAEKLLDSLGVLDAWDWRVRWYRGRCRLAQGRAKEAQAEFDQVYFDVPGELAPKLGLAIAAEMAVNWTLAAQMYSLVLRTDDGFVSAAFGLARCRMAGGDRKGAVEALSKVPQSSSQRLRSQVEMARTLFQASQKPPAAEDLQAAASRIAALEIDSLERNRLSYQVLSTALHLIGSKKLAPTQSVLLLGQKLTEKELRAGIEKSLRAIARLSNGSDKIQLVDEANRVRPRTLL